MKQLTSGELSALAQQSVSLRNLVWIVAKNRTTGAKQSMGFWNDVGTRGISVIDALTGQTVTRNFIGAGSLLNVDDVVATAELQVRELQVVLSGIDANVANAVRGYDARLAPCQVYRLMLNALTGNPVAPARCRFVGVVDSLVINDPRPGGQGRVTLQLVSQMRELSRANPDMTSDDSQKGRAAGAGLTTDRFYQYANAITKWTVAWGAMSLKGQRKQNKKDKD
jgi:hypothetical protein